MITNDDCRCHWGEKFLNLERRMRAEERLLERWGKEIEMAEFYYGWEKDLDAHLEAAKKEDEQ